MAERAERIAHQVHDAGEKRGISRWLAGRGVAATPASGAAGTATLLSSSLAPTSYRQQRCRRVMFRDIIVHAKW
jgi:hypothetical protein